MDLLRGDKRRQALVGVTGFVAPWDFWGHVAAMRMLQEIIDREAREWKATGAVRTPEVIEMATRLYNAQKYLNTIGAARTVSQRFS